MQATPIADPTLRAAYAFARGFLHGHLEVSAPEEPTPNGVRWLIEEAGRKGQTLIVDSLIRAADAISYPWRLDDMGLVAWQPLPPPPEA